MNKVFLMGRLTRDPEIRYTQGERQMAIARYTLAVDRAGKKKEGELTADFIQCVAFDRSAEFAEKYLHQGTKIAVSGRIQTGSYVNKEGQRVYTTDVIVEEQEFAESKNTAGSASQTTQTQTTATAPTAPEPAPQTAAAPPAPAEEGGFVPIPAGDDLPWNG